MGWSKSMSSVIIKNKNGIEIKYVGHLLDHIAECVECQTSILNHIKKGIKQK